MKQRIIETYQRSAGLRETMETLADTYQGAFAGNIKNARRYLTESRYKDYETALNYLFDGVSAEKLKQDLLQMEIVKHRRIEAKK